MRRIALTVLGGALMAALAAGCSTLVPDGDDSSNVDPATIYDGYTTSAEAPAFGDARLLASHPEDLDYDDEIRDNSEVRNALE